MVLQPQRGRDFAVIFASSAVNTWERITINIPADQAFDDSNGAGLYIRIVLSSGSQFTTGLASTWSAIGNDRYAGVANFHSSTSNYVEFTGVQLEVGDTATPFEHRSYGDELAKCQRYFQVGAFARRWTSNGANEYNFFTHYYVTQMRAAPTRTFSGGVFSNIIGSSENTSAEILTGVACQIAYRANATNTDTFVYGRDVTFDAEL